MPVFNVFRMFSRMHGRRVRAVSSRQLSLDEILAKGVRGQPDVGVMASRGDNELAVLVWHYHDDDVAGPDASVRLDLVGLPRGTLAVTHFRIDETHSNSYAAWRRMGSPIAPDKAAWDELSAAAQLATLDTPEIRVRAGKAHLAFTLPRQGVSLLVFALPH